MLLIYLSIGCLCKSLSLPFLDVGKWAYMDFVSPCFLEFVYLTCIFSVWFSAFKMRASILFSLLPLASKVLGSASISDITAKSIKALAAREDVEERGDLEKRVTVSEILTDIEDAATCTACEVCT